MIEQDKEYTVEIESVSSDGNGVARIDNMAVFVPFTAAGDRVKIKITKIKKRYAMGEIGEIIAPSHDRQENDCPLFTVCGGCSLRHIKYDKQLEIKRGIVENAMRRLGGFEDFTLDEIVGMENPVRYRNKTVFHGKDGKLGFYLPKSHDLISVEDCGIGIEENRDIIGSLAPCNVSELFTRKSRATGEIMVSVTAGNEKNIVGALLDTGKNITSVYINNKNVYGKRTITDTLCGVSFDISPESFFQVNPTQTEKLYRKALEYADLKGDENVLDIYCGIGTISLCAAKKAKKVVGVEIVERAIEDAKKNAEKNGILNALFYAGGAEKIVPCLIGRGERFDTVILDPPRSGSDEKTLSAIVKAKPEKIVYVSCGPSTLARDARFLADNGYTINAATAYDMFPHTNHVETVVLMSRVKD